jgi:hypothetical protein
MVEITELVIKLFSFFLNLDHTTQNEDLQTLRHCSEPQFPSQCDS